MKPSRWRSVGVSFLAVCGLAVLLSAAPSSPRPQAVESAVQEVSLSLDLAKSKVHWTVDSTLHMVHGTFNLKNGNLRFDPETGKASGEIIVLVISGESGNSSRDEKMHKEVLQSSRYPEAIFKASQVEGHVARTGASDVRLHGTLSLHGSDHELVVPVHAELANDQWKGTAKFEIPYIQWGLKDPSNFLLKVKPVVNVELEMSGPITQSK
jgi:polyisoprenoid-binding protein YceI